MDDDADVIRLDVAPRQNIVDALENRPGRIVIRRQALESAESGRGRKRDIGEGTADIDSKPRLHRSGNGHFPGAPEIGAVSLSSMDPLSR